MQKSFLQGEPIETIYFGGGTPSLLSDKELERILRQIYLTFNVLKEVEITLEMNPDDFDYVYLMAIKRIGINRLSIGIQSFDDVLLAFFNRVHSATMALETVEKAKKVGFDNFSIDLLFGVPGQTMQQLEKDLDQALALNTPHLSIYGLTIEDNTVFGKMERVKKLQPLEESLVAAQFTYIIQTLQHNGYIQYEISNFCKPNYQSRHNSSYWCGTKYLGVGPAAHSYNHTKRYYNIAHTKKYIDAISFGIIPLEVETLTTSNQINEQIMIQIRLAKGIDLEQLRAKHGYDLCQDKSRKIKQYLDDALIKSTGNNLILTEKGKLLADFITENLII